MLLRVPGLTDSFGRVSDALVEHVDIMATLLDAAGLPAVPLCPEDQPWRTSHCTEGSSFVPLAAAARHLAGRGAAASSGGAAASTADALRAADAAWKNASFSQYPRNSLSIMGYSMVTAAGLRFTAWCDFDVTTNATSWTPYANVNNGNGMELYDLEADPGENVNLADAPANQALVEQLFESLKAGWRSSLPAQATESQVDLATHERKLGSTSACC